MSAPTWCGPTGLTSIRRNGLRNHLAVLRAAAQDPRVQRIFVNAAIKKALCREATGDRSWLNKVRPYTGMIIIFMSASRVRQGKMLAGTKIPCRQETAAMPRSLGGFRKGLFIQSPAAGKPKPPLTMAQLPPRM